MPDDLKADLAKVGSDVQLASGNSRKLDVVSAVERGESSKPSPKAPTVSKAPSTARGTKAPAKSVRHEMPAPAEPVVEAQEVAPVEAPKAEPAPTPVPSQGRPRAPLPSTQREPPGGWKTPGQIIRNAPFPINP
jgi:hypothetical protein